MLNLHELNFKLNEKLKNFEDKQNFKRPAPKLTIFDASEIQFTTPSSKFSKKSKPRQERKLSTDSDFSFGEASSIVTVSIFFFLFFF